MGRFDVALEPWQARHGVAVRELRIVDLETGRQPIDQQNARLLRLALRYLQHDDETLVLLDSRRLDLGSVELVIGPLDRIAGRHGRLGLYRIAGDGQNRLHGRGTRIGERHRVPAQSADRGKSDRSAPLRATPSTVERHRLGVACNGLRGQHEPGLFLGAGAPIATLLVDDPADALDQRRTLSVSDASVRRPAPSRRRDP